MEVGIRELRDHLSRYLDRVRDGEELVVTERGTAVARVVPLDHERLLDRLVSEGVVTPARRRKGPLPDPVLSEGAVSPLVADQRR